MDILKIKQFLNYTSKGYCYGKGFFSGNGYGDGKGNGFGNSSGSGSGFGNGYGDGSGNGYGIGRGDGIENGYGIKNINGYSVFMVDNTSTIFTHIHNNVAKGYILEKNVILKPCYIVKGGGYFAHGETLIDAQNALEEKIMDDMDVEEKIQLFIEKFPETDKKYPAKEFYHWHHNLTGSCEMGRKTFARSHNIDIENDMMTVKEFIELTENAYCGEIIKKLKIKLPQSPDFSFGKSQTLDKKIKRMINFAKI